MENSYLFQEIIQSPEILHILEHASNLLGNSAWWAIDPEGQRYPFQGKILGCPSAVENRQIQEKCQAEILLHLEEVKISGQSSSQTCDEGYVRTLIPFFHQNRLMGCIGICFLEESDPNKAKSVIEILQRYITLYTTLLTEYDDLEYIHDLWEQMVSTPRLEELLPRILEETLRALDLQQGILYLIDDDGKLVPKTSTLARHSQLDYQYIGLDSPVYEQRFRENQELVLELHPEDLLTLWTRQNLRLAKPRDRDQESCYAVPFWKTDHLLGILAALTDKTKNVAQEPSARMLHVITDGASAILETAINLDRIQQRSLALSTIHTIHRLMGNVHSPSELLTRIARLTTQVLQVRKCSIMMLDKDRLRLEPVAQVGLEKGEIGTLPLEDGRSIPGWVWENYEPIIIHSPSMDPRYSSCSDEIYPDSSYLSVPMINEDIQGVITVSGRQAPFSPADRDILLTLSEQAVIALSNIRLIEQHQQLVVSSLRSIANIVEMRDPAAKGHTERVEEIALSLGRAVSDDSRWLMNLRYATLLHDSGKIGLMRLSPVQHPSLRKSVADESEDIEQLYREHPMISMEVAKSMNLDQEAIEMIRYHHENWDGSGFPEGLQGRSNSPGSQGDRLG